MGLFQTRILKSVTTEKIDLLLADWRRKIDLIGQNLIDLHELPTYQRLTGASGYSKVALTGVTASRVTPALEMMSELFEHFSLLSQTIDRAVQLRSSLPRFLGLEQKLKEIEQILTEDSIQLPVRQTPLAQRGLLSVAETTNLISPAQLLAAMMDAFSAAKDVILAVDAAWLRLESTLAGAEAKTKSLQKLADSLGMNLGELSAARQQIAALKARVESDPLGVSTNLDREIVPLILQAKTTVEQLVKQRHQLQEKFILGHELLKQLVELQLSATAAFTESQEKIVDCSSIRTPLAQEKIDALSQWLTRLETKFAEGLLQPVTVGLENWIAKAKEYVLMEEEAFTANKAPLETRKELRGRLDALQAKAIARGLVEDAALVELAETARQLLYTRPTPLARAKELVCQYEIRLNSGRSGERRG